MLRALRFGARRYHCLPIQTIPVQEKAEKCKETSSVLHYID